MKHSALIFLPATLIKLEQTKLIFTQQSHPNHFGDLFKTCSSNERFFYRKQTSNVKNEKSEKYQTSKCQIKRTALIKKKKNIIKLYRKGEANFLCISISGLHHSRSLEGESE